MKKIFAFLFFLTVSLTMFSQSMKTRKWRQSELDSLQKAQLLFEEGNFVMALPIYDKLQESHPKEMYLKYVLGVCGLYRSDMHPRSLELLAEVYEKNKKVQDIEYDLARAYHFNYKFDEAMTLIDKYLGNKKILEKRRKDAEQLKSYCLNAKELLASPVDAKIENIGDVLNTTASEYVPVISSDESVMIFTYRGDKSIGGLQNAYNQPDPMGVYYEDVFITHKENDQWVAASSIGESINTNVHDAAIAISNDGQKLFIYRDNGYNNGDIYLSKLEGDSWSVPEKLQGDINTNSWEGSCALSSDEKTIYFSSEIAGGFGGKDLYKASLMADGTWGNIKNLGSTINTPFDDDAPFIHPDGRTLIYSSKGGYSMGGYDIFKTELNLSDSTWSKPENVGYPINTPDDDIYFVLSADGKRGYYASGKAGGYGLQDIYIVEMPEDFIKPLVVMLKGTITVDSKPVKGEIKIDAVNKNMNYNTVYSNKEDGNYLSNLQAGNNYKIIYSYEGFDKQEKELNLTDLKAYMERVIDVNFSTKDTVKKADSTVIADVPKVNDVLPTQPFDIGNATKEGLIFKVQIAAYNLPKNYSYSHLKGLGEVEKLLLDDKITRFTIGGSFKTLNEAKEHCKKVVAAGQTDAFVTAIYNNKRVYLEDLEKLGLIPPQK